MCMSSNCGGGKSSKSGYTPKSGVTKSTMGSMKMGNGQRGSRYGSGSSNFGSPSVKMSFGGGKKK